MARRLQEQALITNPAYRPQCLQGWTTGGAHVWPGTIDFDLGYPRTHVVGLFFCQGEEELSIGCAHLNRPDGLKGGLSWAGSTIWPARCARISRYSCTSACAQALAISGVRLMPSSPDRLAGRPSLCLRAS